MDQANLLSRILYLEDQLVSSDLKFNSIHTNYKRLKTENAKFKRFYTKKLTNMNIGNLKR
jgi:hypothetical protein